MVAFNDNLHGENGLEVRVGDVYRGADGEMRTIKRCLYLGNGQCLVEVRKNLCSDVLLTLSYDFVMWLWTAERISRT